MSRIGKMPIEVAAGVTVTVGENNEVTVKGPKGELKQALSKDMIIEQNGNVIEVKRPSDDKEHRALHGLTRSLLHNMVVGVTDGFKKKLVMNRGYSHQVEMEEIDGITIDVPQPNQIIISGPDKQKVGQFAANVREKRPPEPYKGKGIKYVDEHIRRKEGKAGSKK